MSISRDYFVVDAPEVGEAYVFRRAGVGWEERQQLSRSQGFLGQASLDGDLLLLGLWNSDPLVYRLEEETWVLDGVLQSASRSTPSYGQFSALGGTVAVVAEPQASTAHLFHRGAQGWVEEETLRGVKAWNVASDGGRVLIGNPPGSALIYRRVSDGDGPGEWTLEATLTPSDGCGPFGSDVSLRGDLALVGSAPDFTSSPCGKAYVFRRQGEEWVEEQILQPRDILPRERFARAVSIDGDRAALGAFASSQFEGGSGFGAAYVYRHDGGEWLLETKIGPSQRRDDWFASSVAVGGGTIVMGAPEDVTRGVRAGAAFVLTLVPGLEALVSVAPERPVAGRSVLFDATASTAPEGMEIASYAWDFGDGETAEGMAVEHEYSQAGRYDVVLTLLTDQERCVQKKLRVGILCEEGEGDLSPWTATDVGEPVFRGNARFLEDGSSLEICAGGENIISRSDEFHFVYQEASGDVSFRVRVDGLDANPRALAGVMIRASLDAAAPHGAMLV